MKTYSIETRLTYDHGGQTGMHCNYPLGLFNTTQSNLRAEIDRGQWPIFLTMDWREGWALIEDVSGQAMTKIRQPEIVAPHYDEHEFYWYGKRYILEIRIDFMEER